MPSISLASASSKHDLWSSEGAIGASEPLNFISWADLEQVANNCGITAPEDIVRIFLRMASRNETDSEPFLRLAQHGIILSRRGPAYSF